MSLSRTEFFEWATKGPRIWAGGQKTLVTQNAERLLRAAGVVFYDALVGTLINGRLMSGARRRGHSYGELKS